MRRFCLGLLSGFVVGCTTRIALGRSGRPAPSRTSATTTAGPEGRGAGYRRGDVDAIALGRAALAGGLAWESPPAPAWGWT
jgi:hypothetical protein